MKKKKRIWIVGHYTMPPQHEVRIKTLMWAKYLMEDGYDVTLISASTLHNTDINLIETSEKYIFKQYENYNFIHIKCSDYKGSGFSRVRNLLQFAYRFKRYAKEFGELPDVILAADIHCINYKPIGDFAKKNNIKFIVDIRDLWPESIVEYLGYSKKNLVIKYLYHREKAMYQMADKIIFSMEGGKDYLINKGWDNEINLDKICHINNGVDLKAFYSNEKNHQLPDPDLDNIKFFKVVYIGSIRKVNNIEILVDAAKMLKENGICNIRILVYGDGNEKNDLEQRCINEEIDTIVFKGQIDNKYIPFVLNRCDLNLMHGASERLAQYGMSLNKSFDYLASGKPILSDINDRYDYIADNGAGINVLCDSENIYKGIIYFCKMEKSKYSKFCKCARLTALKYDFKVLTNKLIEELL